MITITPTTTGSPTLTGSENFNQENYSFLYSAGDLVIDRRAITIAARLQERDFGDTLALDDTAFDVTDRDGGSVLPNNETVTNVSITSGNDVASDSTANAATYEDEILIGSPVAGTDGSGDGFLESNYEIDFVAGDLRVNPREITLTALPEAKTYGLSVTTSITAFSVLDRDGGSSLSNGNVINTVAKGSSVANDPTANAGTYEDDLVLGDIISSSGGFLESNYIINRVAGDYTVNRRAITITASQQSKTYGESVPLDENAFTVSDDFDGGALPNGEVVSSIGFAPTSLSTDSTTDVATYTNALTPVSQIGDLGFDAGNYQIDYESGDYVVTPRGLEITITSQERFAGATLDLDPTAFTLTDLFDGDGTLPNGEQVTSLSITSENGIAGNAENAPGLFLGNLQADSSSIIGAGGFDLANYDVSIVPGDLEVRPFPGIAAVEQEAIMEEWIRRNIGYEPGNVFSNSYAVSNSVGLRLLSLDSWRALGSAKKQQVLTALDNIPLEEQTLSLVEELINQLD